MKFGIIRKIQDEKLRRKSIRSRRDWKDDGDNGI
jgi:hypothetical protein